MPENDAELQLYLQRTVGVHGRVEITRCERFDSWAELPWEPDIGPPTPLPQGKAIRIGVRNQVTLHPGDEQFVVIGDGEPINIAATLSGVIIRALTGFGGRR